MEYVLLNTRVWVVQFFFFFLLEQLTVVHGERLSYCPSFLKCFFVFCFYQHQLIQSIEAVLFKVYICNPTFIF